MSSERTETESTGYYELLTWMTVNKTRLIWAGSAILVVVVGSGIYRYFARQQALEADAALFALHVPVARQDELPPAKSADLLKAYQGHSGTPTAERALMLAASALFDEGKHAEAQAHYDKFRQEFPSSMLVAEALFASGACLEAQGKAKDAMAVYQDVTTRYPNSAITVRARLALASLHERAAEPALALKVYDDLNRPSDRSAWISEVFSRRARLLAQHPELNVELAKTNTQRVTITRVASTNSAGGTNLPANMPKIQIAPAAPAK